MRVLSEPFDRRSVPGSGVRGDTGTEIGGFRPLLCPLPAVYPWTHHLISQSQVLTHLVRALI